MIKACVPVHHVIFDKSVSSPSVVYQAVIVVNGQVFIAKTISHLGVVEGAGTECRNINVIKK
jgi:hypothetical protein